MACIEKKIFFLLPVLLLSCVTSVSFNVQHPPLVDLRNVKSITVIPFEWDCDLRAEHLSRHVTSALIRGLKRGNITFIEPYPLKDVKKSDYWKYVDVYIEGKLINIYSWSYTTPVETTSVYGTKRTKYLTTRYATAYLEYRYIRSSDGEILGYFNKNQTSSITFEQQPDYQFNQRSGRRSGGPPTGRRPGGRPPSDFPRSGSWQEGMAESAISRFSDTMSREIRSYKTPERVKIRGGSGKYPQLDEAKNFLRLNKLDDAFLIYSILYKQTGDVIFGYNAAVLLAAKGLYSQSLALLEKLKTNLIQSGKRIPAFLRNEIKKISDFNYSFTILEGYTEKQVLNTNSVQIAANETEWNISGKTNMDNALIYALNDSISAIDDNSVFSKIVSVAQSEKGDWRMKIPDTIRNPLWFVVTDGNRECYITQTALSNIGINTGIINLDISTMIKLE